MPLNVKKSIGVGRLSPLYHILYMTTVCMLGELSFHCMIHIWEIKKEGGREMNVRTCNFPEDHTLSGRRGEDPGSALKCEGRGREMGRQDSGIVAPPYLRYALKRRRKLPR